MEKKVKQEPFRARCKLCGTVAESWHHSAKAPAGATVGMAACECGSLRVDSMGAEGMGRILYDQSDSFTEDEE